MLRSIVKERDKNKEKNLKEAQKVQLTRIDLRVCIDYTCYTEFCSSVNSITECY